MVESTKAAANEEPKVELADGAAATDPAVHQLLAHRHAATMNGDNEAVEAATAELAKLGYK